jgi:hypothetical protein
MELKEFQKLTGHDVLPGTYAKFEKMYMQLECDKATFCRSVAELAAEYDENVSRPRVAALESKLRDLGNLQPARIRTLRTATDNGDWEAVEKIAAALRQGVKQLSDITSELMRLDGQLR